MAENEIKTSYEVLSHQIEREDGLINTRITWMLTFEGFLFAALALVANDNSDPTIQLILKYVLPIVGSAVAFLALLAISAAFSALEDLRKRWDQTKYPNYPRPFGNENEHASGATYCKGVPIVIIVFWAVVLLAFALDDISK